jgi:hypothetical protein
MNGNRFSEAEVGVAQRIGISRSEIRKIREKGGPGMEEGIDWAKVRGENQDRQHVMLTPAAVELLREKCGVLIAQGASQNAPEAAPSDIPSEAQELAGGQTVKPVEPSFDHFEKSAPPPEPRAAVVTRCNFVNPRVLEAALQGEGDGQVVTVRVRSAANFNRGMVIRVRFDDGQWELAGPCPRWKGRW